MGFVTIGMVISLLKSTAATGSRGSTIGGGIVLGVVSLIFVLLGILFLRVVVRLRRVGSDLHHQGMAVSGVIIDRGTGKSAYTSSRSGGGRNYHVSYRYDCEGKTYSHRQYVPKKYYQSLTEGTSVSVRCLAQDPTVARVVDPRRGSMVLDASKGDPLTFALLAVCFLVIAVLLAVGALSILLNG